MEMVPFIKRKRHKARSQAPQQKPDSKQLDMESRIKLRGQSLFKQAEGSSQSLFSKDWWYGRLMDWSMKNEAFKTQMFRFVDVLPYLTDSQDVARHLKEYFAENGEELPSVFNFGLGMGHLAPSLMASTVRKNVTEMAKMFITGETPQAALPVLEKSRKNGVGFTVDLLGEATLSEKEALEYQNRYLEIIDELSHKATSWAPHDLLDTDERGDIPRVNVSVKITALYSQIKEAAWEESIQAVMKRLDPLFQRAVQQGAFINIDMEQYAHKDLTLEVFRRMLSQPEYKNYPHWGIVIQAYLKDSYEDLQKLVEFAKQRKTPFMIRLVKGAYWDYEVIHANQMDWPVPVYTVKQETDANYERCARLILGHHDHLRLAIGSHNVRSIAAALEWANELSLDQKAVEVQMLYGMGDPFKKALVGMGYRVREYATVGELIPGMAYLVRRLLENTSNESFLRSRFAEQTSIDVLLQNPAENLSEVSTSETSPPELFTNEPLKDFALADSRDQMKQALEKARHKGPQKLPLIIGGEESYTKTTFQRYNPSHPDQLVGEISMASVKEAQKAIDVAQQAKTQWKRTSPEERAQYLERVAEFMKRDRYDLMALEVLEAGKTWTEADADVAEAIDFCRYYAQEMRRLASPQRVGHALGEVSHTLYQPRGVAVVIAPWNFPLAILTGMVTASLVTGNTVIMKPAEQTSVTGWELMRLFQEAGIPPGVVSYLPGVGEEIGPYLTEHPEVQLIAFTGSKAVGLEIVQKAGVVVPGQTRVKHCIIEMGGKNAIIIDSDADLDEAVAGVVDSAFGFQGQKCSACSRVIVFDGIYDRFIERLIEAVKSLPVGPAEDPRSNMGPVVDKEAQDKIWATIERAKQQAKLLYQGDVPQKGYFVPATIFGDVDPQSSLAQEEIFGPVLAVLRVTSIDEALNVANDTAYGLTGGLYSRSPAHIEKIKQEFEVGNLYINRGITGALVDRHPFGGFKMSGLGSKTGSQDYLLQFMEPRAITENTMRRGFAPTEA